MSVTRTQLFLDRIVPFKKARWTVLALCLSLFWLRVYTTQGYYCQAYALSLELLSVAIDFFSPAEDPELSGANDEPDILPLSTRAPTSTAATIAASTSAATATGRGSLNRAGAGADASQPTGSVTPDMEYRPFRRKSGEFKSWKHAMQSTLVLSFLSSFEFLNIDVYVPFLVIYFILLFSYTVYRRIDHMRRYKYTPFSTPKPTYSGASTTKLYEQKVHKPPPTVLPPAMKKKATD